MLVNGRAAMVRRAITSFLAQTYESKRLIILDTGTPPADLDRYPVIWEESAYHPEWAGKTIGWLRNVANRIAWDNGICDLIAHWDSDDWSHPRRLEEQVALLEPSGKMCVGYRELLFWDTRAIAINDPRCVSAWQAVPGSSDETPRNEAWIYRNHQANWAAGASLLYRRELWEQQPFDDAPHEDQRWMMTPAVSRQCVGVSSIPDTLWSPGAAMRDDSPRMVCGIHGSNSEAYDRTVMLRNPDVWRRAPEFDSYCKEKMRL